MRTAGFHARGGRFRAQILARFCGENGFSVLSSGSRSARCSTRSPLPERLLIPYAKLKFQEPMLLLSVMDAARDPKRLSGGADRAHSADYDQMMSDMSQRCTIEMLSQQYHINTSTLKEPVQKPSMASRSP